MVFHLIERAQSHHGDLRKKQDSTLAVSYVLVAVQMLIKDSMHIMAVSITGVGVYWLRMWFTGAYLD